MDAQAAWRTRCRRRSNLAHPYIWRLRSLSRVTWPSVCPLLYGSSQAARTAASCWRPVAKRFRSGSPLIRTVSIQLCSSLGVRWRTIWANASVRAVSWAIIGSCGPICSTCACSSGARFSGRRTKRYESCRAVRLGGCVGPSGAEGCAVPEGRNGCPRRQAVTYRYTTASEPGKPWVRRVRHRCVAL